MEQYTVFLGWNKLYYENDHTAKGSLHIQHNPNQIINGIFLVILMIPPSLLFFLKIILVIQGLLCFHRNLKFLS